MLDGYRFLGLSVYGRESETVLFDGDGFIMPAFDVSVVLLWEEITYKITFKDGNRVLAELVCKQGEIPKPPSTVKKLDDFEFSYTFKGWSNDITPAHSDAVYYAVFDSVPLPPKVEPSGLQISPRVMKLLIALAVAICMFITVVIPSVTILVCLLVRDGKLRIKRRKK
jgi:hypothetical protein